jgi:hypothetical protein
LRSSRGGVMGIIMINCPATGRRVSTGIETVDIEELPAVTAKMSGRRFRGQGLP